MKKIAVISLGCPKNLVDSELIIGGLENRFQMTLLANEADYIVVNTCGFIESAKQESIDAIIEACENKKNEEVKVIVTGCLAKRYREEIEKELPEVSAVVGIGDLEGILRNIEDGTEQKEEESTLSYKKRKITTGLGYAYLRISDGCDNHCTYCAIPAIRGKYKSRDFEEILDEARLLAAQGIKEIVIVAQDTTYYGIDLYGERRLAQLLKKIGEIESIHWIRLMYAYPEQIGEDLLEQFEKNPKLCKYIDMPIQHISPKILTTMGRRGSAADIAAAIENLRTIDPDFIIRTTF